jgi:HSP20 family molecular chaperone IbpA
MLSNTIFINNIKEFKFTEEEQILEKRNMKLITDSPLSLKKCFTDELGFSLFKTGNFEPKYNYFKSDEKTLEIRLEVPGNTNCTVNHKVIGDKTIITVLGEKNRDKTPKEEKDNIKDIREFGNFELELPLPVEEYKIVSTEPKEKLKFLNGICIIKYELASEGADVTGKPEEEV